MRYNTTAECGEYGRYAAGCRCDLCRAANAARARERRLRGPDIDPFLHLLWERDTDLGWLDDAACRGYPTDWWFVNDGRNPNTKTAKRALQICDGCPVRADCLDWALSIPHPWIGIFAGLTPQQRKHEQKRRNNDTRNNT